MKIKSRRIIYESPQIITLDMEVEKGFIASGDPVITNPDMEWGD
jgi:hypothetical protein